MRCAMFGCCVNNLKKNNNGEISFHAFPKKQKMCKQWVFLCHRKDKLNTNTARICSKHFKEDDYVPLNPLYEQYGLFMKIRRLKENTVPSLLLPFQKQEQISSLRCLRLQNRSSISSAPLAANSQNIKIDNDLSAIDDCTETKLQITTDGTDSVVVTKSVGIGSTQTEAFGDECSTQTEAFKEESSTQTNETASTYSKLQEEYVKLKAQCVKQKATIDSIGHIFTKGQIKKLESSGKRIEWSAEDIANAITIYAAGRRAYRLLLRKNYPLPDVVTLKKWCAKLEVYPGKFKEKKKKNQ